MKPYMDLHMAQELYRASPGLSYSETKLLARSAAHLRHARDNPQEFKPSPQMALGSALHCALLEPARFDRDYILDPGLNKNSNAYKDFAEDCRRNKLMPITAEERDRVLGMCHSLRRNAKIAKALSKGYPEVSCWWENPEHGVACKGRLDWLHQLVGGWLPCDVKTTADASPEAFSRSVANFEYHRQADWYERGLELVTGEPVMPMLFIVVETAAPYVCKPYTLSPWFMRQARLVNDRLLALYAHCCAMGEWPGYDPEITTLEPTPWMLSPELRDAMREEVMA